MPTRSRNCSIPRRGRSTAPSPVILRANCMVHSGYVLPAVNHTFSSLSGLLAVCATLFTKYRDPDALALPGYWS